jgi:hypothetical protein
MAQAGTRLTRSYRSAFLDRSDFVVTETGEPCAAKPTNRITHPLFAHLPLQKSTEALGARSIRC